MGETHHRALTDEPDACCYAYRAEGSGERRESGRGVEEREGGEAECARQLRIESSSPLPGRGDGQASGRRERSRMPRNAWRREEGGGAGKWSEGLVETGIHLLNSPIFRRSTVPARQWPFHRIHSALCAIGVRVRPWPPLKQKRILS